MAIIDGKALSILIKDDIKEKSAIFKKKYGRDITLAVVLIGDNPASKIYVKNKVAAAEYCGINSLSFYLPSSATQNEAEKLIKSLVDDETADGILVQLPLPKGFDEKKILSLIPKSKDVDGFSAENIGDLTLFNDCISPCTPQGIIYMLKKSIGNLGGLNAVVIGRSNIVGKPVALMLLKENCTVTVCHSKTVDLKEKVLGADLVVAAIGKPKFITADMIKAGATVIDVGINRTENGICGDVDFENVKDKAKFITPVPGGVGPMTIAMLMQNVYKCAVNRVK